MCTTEIIAFSKANTYFERLNTCLLGLSVDSNSSHLAWVYDIYCKTGVKVPFPIIVIDDKGIIRLILVYPLNIGRCIPEILRIIEALQTADNNNASTPVNWVPCEPIIIPAPKTFEQLQERNKQIQKDRNGMAWYLSFKEPKDCKVIENGESKQLREGKKLDE